MRYWQALAARSSPKLVACAPLLLLLLYPRSLARFTCRLYLLDIPAAPGRASPQQPQERTLSLQREQTQVTAITTLL